MSTSSTSARRRRCDPWDIVPASPEATGHIAEALAGHRPVASRFEGLMAAYYEALATGGPLPVTLADARQSLELATALYHSAATGAAVALPISPDHPSYLGWRQETLTHQALRAWSPLSRGAGEEL